MSKALVTFATGPAKAQLEVSEPGFREYADRHGYEFRICEDIPTFRPPSWFKVLALRDALQEHDEALWLDADILILDGEQDIAEDVWPGAWQGLVVHHTPDGEVPNHGVWFVRRPMLPVLAEMWRMDEYTHHPWWEQAAGCELLGYDPLERPMELRYSTKLYARTAFLGTEWNSHRDDEALEPRFWHASVRGSDRAALMREKLQEVTCRP